MSLSNFESTERLRKLSAYLARDLDNLPLRLDAISAAIECEDLKMARSMVDAGVIAHPDAVGLYVHAANLELVEGKYDAAIQCLDLAIEKSGGSVALRYNRACLQCCVGDYEGSMRSLMGIRSGDLLAERTVLGARCASAMGQLDVALSSLEDLDTSGYSTPESLGVLALVRLDLGLYDDVLSAAERALSSEPAQLEALLARAGVSLMRGERVGARSDYVAVTKRQPNEGRAWLGLSQLDLLDGDVGAARTSLECAIACYPKDPAVWQVLAWCHLVGGDSESARVALETALGFDKANADTLAGIALLSLFQGHRSDAEVSLRAAQDVNPASDVVQLVQAVLAAPQSQGGRAIDEGALIGGDNTYPITIKGLREALAVMIAHRTRAS